MTLLALAAIFATATGSLVYLALAWRPKDEPHFFTGRHPWLP